MSFLLHINGDKVRRLMLCLTGVALVFSLNGCAAADSSDPTKLPPENTEQAVLGTAHSNKETDGSQSGQKPIVAIAWRPQVPAKVVTAFEQAGAEVLMLPQVMYRGFSYGSDNCLSDTHLSPSGMLAPDSANLLKSDWQNSNVEEIVQRATLIVFSGGADISPSLYQTPDIEKNAGEKYDATRDVSDYILMQYCLQKDLPVFGICQGMQVLAVASGASMIQDIPGYYEQLNKTENEYHRKRKGEGWEYAAHDVEIVDTDSRLYAIAQTESIPDVPSWHHQAVTDLEDTNLKVTASAAHDGVEIIEGVERTDLQFALGVQFHPEIPVANASNGIDTSGKYTDVEYCLDFFRQLLIEAQKWTGSF